VGLGKMKIRETIASMVGGCLLRSRDEMGTASKVGSALFRRGTLMSRLARKTFRQSLR